MSTFEAFHFTVNGNAFKIVAIYRQLPRTGSGFVVACGFVFVTFSLQFDLKENQFGLDMS